jgi:ABC-type multidrug transport system ATPase subunit
MVILESVEKAFGKRVVLRGVSLRLQAGCTYGLCGRNGAGKTTLLRLITGMASPDAGKVRVMGKDPVCEWAVRREMGIVEDGDTYFPELTASEYLWWVGRLRGVEEKTCRGQTERLAKAFYIEDRLNDLTGSLSHGMRRKVAIASAFVGEPRLLVMDEPTNGLDVDSVRALCGLLIEHRKAGGTALLACHDREFLARASSHTITIDGGTVSEPVGIGEVVVGVGR